MACQFCKKNLFKEKLGRCRFCMWTNFVLLMITGPAWFIRFQSAPTQVETIALLFAFIASALLMIAHISAYLYYRSKGIKHPTRDIGNLK